jgi:hypothetical protein
MTLTRKELEDLMASYLQRIAEAKLNGGNKEEISHYEKELRLVEMAYDDAIR